MQLIIFISLLICILFFCIISFIIFKKKLISILENNVFLLEKNEELLHSNSILKEKLSFLNIKLESIYEELENKNILPASLKSDFNLEKILTLHHYPEFIIRLKDEIERKRRYSFFSFSIMRISVDFFDEYIKVYGNGIDSFLEEFKLNILNSIRKIDFFCESKDKNVIYGLLPMTELDGAVVLAKRIQNLSHDISLNKIVTLTISIVQIDNNFDITSLLKNLKKLSVLGENSGGNIIKVKKL